MLGGCPRNTGGGDAALLSGGPALLVLHGHPSRTTVKHPPTLSNPLEIRVLFCHAPSRSDSPQPVPGLECQNLFHASLFPATY